MIGLHVIGLKLLWVGHLHQVLSASHFRSLGKLVSSMKSLVVLGLTNCNIQSIELNLPNLLRLDVSGNRLAGNKQVGMPPV
jgi:Leucine-rich repeat (LRR) protein